MLVSCILFSNTPALLHSHGYPRATEAVDLKGLFGAASVWLESHRQESRAWDGKVGGSVLVSKSMPEKKVHRETWASPLEPV